MPTRIAYANGLVVRRIHGPVTVQDLRALDEETLRAPWADRIQKVVLDARDLDTDVDASVLQELAKHVQWQQESEHPLHRQPIAILVSDHLASGLSMLYSTKMDTHRSVQTFDDPDRAAAWLGVDPLALAELLVENFGG